MRPVHFSDLKRMALSPAHYKHGLTAPREETRAMRIGSAADALIYKTRDVVTYPAIRRGKDWDAFAAEHAESIILNQSEAEHVDGMVRALLERPDAMELLDGQQQQTIDWAINGRACQGTPDVVNANRIVDLKTSNSTDPERFWWHAVKMGWIAQLAWYQNGLVCSGRVRPEHAYIVAVESAPPHPVTIFELTERAIDLGHRTWRLWFERLMVCEQSDEWPPYAVGIVPLDPPDMEGLTLRIDGEEVEVSGE